VRLGIDGGPARRVKATASGATRKSTIVPDLFSARACEPVGSTAKLRGPCRGRLVLGESHAARSRPDRVEGRAVEAARRWDWKGLSAYRAGFIEVILLHQFMQHLYRKLDFRTLEVRKSIVFPKKKSKIRHARAVRIMG
jgi:hypothetical protein